MKPLSKIVPALYLVVLLWLVLFKFSINLPSLFDLPRSVNLMPFANYSHDNLNELVYNFMVFVPFGLFLGVNLKQAGFWRKLAIVLAFSLAVETIQFIFAIGIADITDVISNTSGGLIGLVLYGLINKYVHDDNLDRSIIIAASVLLALFILLLGILFAHGVRFHRPAPSGMPRLQW